ncbi:MAG: hypothetical protein ACJ741_15435, partial [Pyrinomonadaceae bacterium]
MMPQQQPVPDAEALQELGRASVEIVHDIKNQLNGLKLYATFLKRRFDKFDRPEDEVETISKLIAGLERAAAEMNILVRLGRNIEIHPSGPTDLRQVLERVRNENAESLSIELPETAVQSRIDQQLFPEALSEIARWALGTIGDIGSRTIT